MVLRQQYRIFATTLSSYENRITVMEVNTARLYNWDVVRRRERRAKEAVDCIDRVTPFPVVVRGNFRCLDSCAEGSSSDEVWLAAS